MVHSFDLSRGRRISNQANLTARATVLANAGMATQDTTFVPLCPSAHGNRVEVTLEKEAGAVPQKKVRGTPPSPPQKKEHEERLSAAKLRSNTWIQTHRAIPLSWRSGGFPKTCLCPGPWKQEYVGWAS